MTTSKLDDKLEDKRSIKFTDYAINKHQANFENVGPPCQMMLVSKEFQECLEKVMRVLQFNN